MMKGAPSKRMKLDLQGMPIPEQLDKDSILDKISDTNDQFLVNSAVQQSASIQLGNLEEWVKKAEQSYPTFESVEAIMKEITQEFRQHVHMQLFDDRTETTGAMDIMKKTLEEQVKELGKAVKLTDESGMERRGSQACGQVYLPVSDTEFKEFKDLVWAQLQQYDIMTTKSKGICHRKQK